MDIRFYIDPATGEPHLRRHGITEEEAAEVLGNPTEDRPGIEGARVAIGRTAAGRILRVIYVQEPDGEGLLVVTSYELRGKPLAAVPTPETTQKMSRDSQFPPGWDEERVRRLLAHYEEQTEDEAVAEDEAAFEESASAVVEVPKELVAEVRKLIARHRAS